jgi:hypothetical protein
MRRESIINLQEKAALIWVNAIVVGNGIENGKADWKKLHRGSTEGKQKEEKPRRSPRHRIFAIITRLYI